MGWFEDAHKTMVENLQTFNLQTHLDKYPVGSDIYPVVPIRKKRLALLFVCPLGPQHASGQTEGSVGKGAKMAFRWFP